ncbi:MAG: hypothetical protein UHH95_02220, partial [Oscillospiraceae bacterium]|nr:hypothetical protein [Oscillospiraceae bacterium]
SHDRYFLEKIPNKILNLKNNTAQVIKGNYCELSKFLELQRRSEAETVSQEKKLRAHNNSGHRSREQRALDAQRRNELSRLEKEVESLENSIKEMEAELSDTKVFADFKRSAELCNELEYARHQYEKALEDWLDLSES